MATNRGRNAQGDNNDSGGQADDSASPAVVGQGDAAELDARNADESRAVGDPAPDWATGDSVPEVMSTKDQRRAGVLDSLRNQRSFDQRVERTADAGAVAVVGPATAWLDNSLREAMRTVDGGAAHAVEDIVARIAEAETLDDILAEDSVMDAADLLDIPLQIWGFKVNESEFQQGMPGYMVVKAIRQDTKEDVLFTTGAYKVQAQLLRMDMLKLFPAMVKIVKKAEATKGGFFPLALVKA